MSTLARADAPARRPMILVPFNRREAISLREAAKVAGRCESTVRGWCGAYDIGRRIGNGPWQVSRVALAMFLDGAEDALRAYLAGDRTGELVEGYLRGSRRNLARSAKRGQSAPELCAHFDPRNRDVIIFVARTLCDNPTSQLP